MKRKIVSLLGVFGFLILVGSAYHFASAYVEGDYTKDTVANNVAEGETNVNFAYLELPDPTTDTIVTNGATAVVAATDALSAFPATHQFFDKSDNNTYADGNGVISSADVIIGAGDTVLTTATGVLEAFSGTFAETGSTTGIGWIDNITDDNILEATEDIVSIVANLAQVSNGLLARTFETDIYFLADSSSTTEYNASDDNAVVEDADADGYLTAGDNVLIAGKGSVYNFGSSGDDVCFDGSVVNDGEYDEGEVIWWDNSGGNDCSSFLSGTDIILVGSSAPTGTSTEFFGNEDEVGYLDQNGTGADGFTCSRAGDCEALVYSGADGVDLSADATLPVTAEFFDSSSEATDGIRTTGDAWDESGNALQTHVQFSSVTTNGEVEYVYLDADTNTDFTSTDPIMQVIDKGADNIASGQDFRSFKDNDYRLFDHDDDGVYDDGTDGLVGSDDNDLDPSDTLVNTQAAPTPAMLEAFPSTHRFHDHDSSGSYADGDDVINDSDESTYYNADDLLSLGITVTGSTTATNGEIDDIYVYERAGGACAGSGTDTLLGSVSGDVLDENIAITRAPFTAADDITLCFYLDAAADFTAGRTFQAQTGATNPITYSSGADSGSMGLKTGSDALTVFYEDLTATVSSSDLSPSATASYTISYTVTNNVPASSNIINTFPAGFDISGMSIACTDDGGAITGSSTILGQIAAVANIGAQVDAGSAVSCVVSDVVNPAAEGASAAFVIGPAYAGTSIAERDDDETVTIATPSAGGGSTEASKPKTWDVSLLSPNGGEQVAAGEAIEIMWQYLGTGAINYVNLAYSIDEGETWTDIVKNTANDMKYSWITPMVNTAKALVRVATTDLAHELFTDESDAVFSIGDISSGGESTDDVEESSDPGIICNGDEFPAGIEIGDHILGVTPDGVQYPAVFYVGEDCRRHPYLNEPHYFTYGFTDFSNVEIYSTLDLERISVGKSMPIKPGTVLVKTTDNPTVYYIQDTGDPLNPELYSIPSEEVAIEYFGADWAERIIDVAPHYLTIFEDNGRPVTDLQPSLVSNMYQADDLRAR